MKTGCSLRVRFDPRPPPYPSSNGANGPTPRLRGRPYLSSSFRTSLGWSTRSSFLVVQVYG
eukprot:8732282-Prorocentrum_lima.AAC.1